MRIEVEIDETKGEVVGDVPEALKGIFTRIENNAHGQGYGKGAAKAAEEAKAQIAKEIADARARFDAEAPIKAARFEQMETDYKGLQARLLEQERAHNNTLKDQGEKHARELLDRADRMKKFGERITALTREQLRGEASRAGAREESLDELVLILGNYIGFDDDMNPFVKNPDGSQRLVQGKPMAISALAKEYLDGHTHHKKTAGGTGGGARGGASFSGQHANVSADAARARVEGGDRSSTAINDLFEATRRKTA